MKKIISMMLSLSMLASTMAFVQSSAGAAAIPTPEETTLFSDDFEGYTEGFKVTTANYGKVESKYVNSTFNFYNRGIEWSPAYYSEAANPNEVMQVVTAETSGIGTGSSLMVTAQMGIGHNQLIKVSGIDEEATQKRIVFTTKFKVPTFVGFSDGAGVYLTAASASGVYVPDSVNGQPHLTNNTTSKVGELIYLGARPGSSVTNGWAYGHIGTKHNQLWTFGEKVADLEAGKEYTYTITMTPNASGKYDITTNLNGTEYTLGQEAYTTSSTIPTTEEMATFTAVRVMRLAVPYNFRLGHTNKTDEASFGTWLSSGYGAGLGITTSEGLYDNDRAVAYFDDMSMKAMEVMDTVFEDDFENGYENDIIPGTTGWGKKLVPNYDYDTFNWMCGGVNDYSTNANFSSWVKAAPTPANAAVIEENTGVGNGKALKFTGQIGITGYAMAKKSNLDTANIAGKQLEFRADFKAPISGVMGEGFGVWLDADVETDQIITVSENTGIIDGNGALLKGELMYVGSRNNVEKDGAMGLLGARATYLYVFGEEVARLNPDAVYDLKVTLMPNGEGYMGAVTLNGRNIALSGTYLPTQAEMAAYNRLYASPVTHAWRMLNSGGAMWAEATRPADMVDPETGYIMGRTVGVLDNISMIARNNLSLPTADAAVNMTAVDTDWTSKGTSFVNALATVSGQAATVEVRSDKATDVTPVILAATYDADGRLMNVVINDTTTVEPFGTEIATLSGLAEGYTSAKVFLWDMEEIEPYTSSKTAIPEGDADV